MVWIGRDCNLQALVSQLEVADTDSDMADVVVDVRESLVVRQDDSALEAVHCHVVLGCIEGAEADVIPKFTVIDSTLDKSPVEPESHLWLVCVEMIVGD